MSEIPDFEHMARQFSPDGAGVDADDPRNAEMTALVADLLRMIWNARGAADLKIIETALAQKPTDVLAQLRALDRRTPGIPDFD